MTSRMPSRARARSKARPSSPQGQKVQELAKEVGRMSSVYDEVQRNRESYQKHLNEMLEETVMKIKHAHFHMQEKAKHVRESRFEHDLSASSDALRRDLDEATAKMEGFLDGLNTRMSATEAALKQQREARLAHTEATLGPLRDEASRLTAALKAERKARQHQEREQEKFITDEVEAIFRLIDKEKFSREQQLMELRSWAEPEQEKISKLQSHVERETRDGAETIRVAHRAMATERISSQHKIIECISGFVNRYRVHLNGISGLEQLEEALAAAPTHTAA